MSDPIVKAIQASIVSITLSNGPLGARLAVLRLLSDANLPVALRSDGITIAYSRERVKCLTVDQLKSELIALL